MVIYDSETKGLATEVPSPMDKLKIMDELRKNMDWLNSIFEKKPIKRNQITK